MTSKTSDINQDLYINKKSPLSKHGFISPNMSSWKTDDESLSNYFPLQRIRFHKYLAGKAAKLLNTTPNNLYLLEDFVVDMRKDHDTVLEIIPIEDNAVPVSFYGKHSKRQFYVGHDCIVLYQCFGKDLKYVLCHFKVTASCNVTLIFVQKGNLFKLKRHFKRKEVTKESILPPILEQHMFDSIYKNTLGFLHLVPKIKQDNVCINRGIIFGGGPGNGKTMMCNWIEKQANNGKRLIKHVTGSEIESAYSGNKMFSILNEAHLIFFDDVDISFFSRKHDGNARVCCSFLSALDGMQKSTGIVRIFTTNEEISNIDPAFLRPGRIDAVFTFHPPNTECRRKIIGQWGEEINKNIDIEKIVKKTEGWSGAEINAIKNFVMLEYYETGEYNADKAMKIAIESRPDIAERKQTGFLSEVE